MCREARKRDRLSVLKDELEKALLFASRRGYLGKNLKKRQILMGKRFFFFFCHGDKKFKVPQTRMYLVSGKN